MGQKTQVVKPKQKVRQIDQDLLERMVEVRRLKRQVRLAEAAFRAKTTRPHV